MLKNLFVDFPEADELLEWYSTNGSNLVHHANLHVHFPFLSNSYPDFTVLAESAKSENIKILGINDFSLLEKHEEFADVCVNHRIFPVIHSSMEGIHREDPRNDNKSAELKSTGRFYLTSSATDFWTKSENGSYKKLEKHIKRSENQNIALFQKIQEKLTAPGVQISLSYDLIKEKYSQGIISRRHFAETIRKIIYKEFTSQEERKRVLASFLGESEYIPEIEGFENVESRITEQLYWIDQRIFDEKRIDDLPTIENLMKVVSETGGIPTYPVVFEDYRRNNTDFVQWMEELMQILSSKNIFSIEIHPQNFESKKLKEIVVFFHDRSFVVSLGTGLSSQVRLSCKDKEFLHEELNRINFESACLFAAHQYLRAKGEEGVTDRNGKIKLQKSDEFIELGNAVIEYYLSH